jgi:hypothetical protein
MLPRILPFIFSILVVFSAYASPLNNNNSAALLSQGIYIDISPKGQESLSGEFQNLLSSNGISLDELVLPEYIYESDKAWEIVDFPEGIQDSVLKIKNIFEEWLLGFQWVDPWPRIEAGPLLVSNKSLGVKLRVLHPRQTENLRIQIGLELKNFKFEVDRVRLQDLNNDFIGLIGVDKYTLVSLPDSPNFKVNVVLQARIDDGLLTWKLESLKSNLSELKLQASFNRPLILPEVEIRVGTRRHLLNNEALEARLVALQPELIQKIQAFGSEWIENDLIEVVDQMPREALDLARLGETSTFAPPGAPKDLPAAQFFHWKLVPESLSNARRSLRLGLAVNLWDPVNTKMPPIDPRAGARDKPTTQPDDSKVDLNLILNQGFLNRVVQLSFARKYFEKHELEPGEYIRFKSPPTLTVPEGLGVHEMELFLDFESPLTGFKGWLVGSAVHVQVPVRARFVARADNKGFQMNLVSVDISRMWVNPKSVNWPFRGTVEKEVRKKFTTLNAEWAKKPSVLLDQMPVPDSIAGLELDMKDIRTDAAGYVHFLIDLKKSQTTRSQP